MNQSKKLPECSRLEGDQNCLNQRREAAQNFRQEIADGSDDSILGQSGFDLPTFCDDFKALRECLANRNIETAITKIIRANLAVRLSDLTEILDCKSFKQELVAKIKSQISEKSDEQLLTQASRSRVRQMSGKDKRSQISAIDNDETNIDEIFERGSGNGGSGGNGWNTGGSGGNNAGSSGASGSNSTSYYGDGSVGGEGDGNAGEESSGNYSDYAGSGATSSGSDEGSYYNNPVPVKNDSYYGGELYHLYYDDVFQDNPASYQRIPGHLRTGDIIAIVAFGCICSMLIIGFGYVLYQKMRHVSFFFFSPSLNKFPFF